VHLSALAFKKDASLLVLVSASQEDHSNHSNLMNKPFKAFEWFEWFEWSWEGPGRVLGGPLEPLEPLEP